MYIYKLLVSKTAHGFLLRQPDFDFEIDADTVEDGIKSAIDQIEKKGVLILKDGGELPKPVSEDDITVDMEDGTATMYVPADIDHRFKESASESVRKNISMPSWMDIRLRYYGVDASKLFQDAAATFLEQKEHPAPVEYRKIETVEELKANVDEKVLDEYLHERVFYKD